MNERDVMPVILTADLTHVATGISVEYRNELVIVAGHVAVESLQSATELLTEEAA